LPNELEFLRDAIVNGKIDGSSYAGECACLAGTLAHAKGIKNYDGGEIKNGLTFHADSSSPRERFFLAIKKGDTPKSNGASKVALEWTEEAISIRDNIRKTASVGQS
jgi:acylphosphatase